jgi:NAD dependent epimerase/dehydratase family enzyme
MGPALLLASTRVEPRRLLASGFQFQLPELEAAVQKL